MLSQIFVWNLFGLALVEYLLQLTISLYLVTLVLLKSILSQLTELTTIKCFCYDYYNPSSISRSLAFLLSNLTATNLLMKT